MGEHVRRTTLPPTVTGRLFEQALAIEADALNALLASDPQALAGYGPRTARNYLVAEGVAVVPVVGTLMARGTGIDQLDALLGICALDQLRETLLAAAADGTAMDILLDVESGGGPVAGMFDFASFIAKVHAQKPVTTFARKAMSAAYLMASATGRIVVPPNDPLPAVGSIGVLAVRRDVTAQDAAGGVAYHFVTSGAAKGDGNEHKPTTDAELGRLQALVDDAAAMFFASVAQARGLTPEHVRGLEARTFRAQAAVDAGLADAVATFEDTILELATRPRDAGAAPRRMSMSTQAQGAGAVANIEDHPEFKAKMDAAGAQATERANRIVALCVLAGEPAKSAEFLVANASVDSVQAWALEQQAKRGQPAAQVSGVQPAETPAQGTPVALDVTAIFAKRRTAVLEAQARHAKQLH
jgi:ClpP class serine protease